MNSFTSSGFTNFMKMAIEQAKIAQSAGEVPVGAVLLGPAGDVLAKSGNRTRELKDPSAHAEVLVIREACQVLGNERLIGCDLYVTLEPCAMCAALIQLLEFVGSIMVRVI